MTQIVGIDLGTTNSLVAAIVDGQPTLIPNERG
jgi:molecular chaperone DnaK (HSP70)